MPFSFIKNQTIAVTGIGSIGSELCKKIAENGAKQLVMIDISENNLYETEQSLKCTHPELGFIPYVVSIRDREKLEWILTHERPSLLVHTAAHKHVPLMERVPDEAVKNNIFGTLNVTLASASAGIGKVILISTDKAVEPSCVYGATKRVCELIFGMMNKISANTIYNVVRFGNVIGSRGSVIPLFEAQAASGHDLTVTHPDVTRYFMSIENACDLILEASELDDRGKLFLLDMDKPVNINKLAENIIKKYEDKNIKIIYTGLRNGEKIHEKLSYDNENLMLIPGKHILRADLPETDVEKLKLLLSRLEKAADEPRKIEEIEPILKEIIPEFKRI